MRCRSGKARWSRRHYLGTTKVSASVVVLSEHYYRLHVDFDLAHIGVYLGQHRDHLFAPRGLMAAPGLRLRMNPGVGLGSQRHRYERLISPRSTTAFLDRFFQYCCFSTLPHMMVDNMTLDKAHVLHRQLGLRAGACPRDLEERKRERQT